MDNAYIYGIMSKLTKDNWTRTYFTLAELRPEDAKSDLVVYVILPVDVYILDGLGFEIMPVAILAKHCPWDMEKTIVKIDTEYTHIMENLHDTVVEDAELHKHLSKLEGK